MAATLYTSNLINITNNQAEILIDRISISLFTFLELSKYSAQDEFIETIIPPTTYIENNVENKTRLRVFLNSGQVLSEEKIQIKLVQEDING